MSVAGAFPVQTATREFVDLHIHSSYSGDGQYSPREIFALAADSGMGAFAICDHDTVDGLSEALVLAGESGVQFIPSIELTTDCAGNELHILGPCIQWDCLALQQALEDVCHNGEKQAVERVALLRHLGFEISYEEVIKRTGGTPSSGFIIAAILLNREGAHRDRRLAPYISGARSDRPEVHFYRDYLGQGAPAYVPRQWMPASEAIALVLQCGGVPILAHPGAANFGAGERIIAGLKDAGLAGLEVFTSYHDEKARRHFLLIARRLDLVTTAGSDFHGRTKPHVRFGSIRDVGSEAIDALLRRRRAPAPAERSEN